MFTQPLIIGSTYRLKFKSAFERHGVCSTPGVTCLHQGGGVFRLEQITNFRDLVLAGIKLYDVFFAPLGFTREQYARYFDGKPDDELTPEYTTETISNEIPDVTTVTDENGALVVADRRSVVKHDIHVETGRSLLKKHYKDDVNYASYPIYKFVDVIDTNDVIYVPELTIAEFPEIDIREYKDLSLVVHLGYIDTPNKLDPMLLAIRERMAVYGWRPSLIKLYATDTKWMGPDEYARIQNLRVPATIETIDANNRDFMIGETAIIGGQMKKIVETVTDAATELAVGAVAKKPQILDDRLFRTQCQDGDVFETGRNYFVAKPMTSGSQQIACWKLLKEGIDYTIGNPCIYYREATADELADTNIDKFTREDDNHVAVEYGHHGDYDPERLFARIETHTWVQTTDTARVEDKTYYIRVDVNNYREATDADFNADDSFKNDVIYYNPETVEYSYTQATDDEIADPNHVLYIVVPYTYTKTTNIQSGKTYYVRVLDVDEHGTPTGYTSVYKEEWATVSTHDAQGNITRVGTLDLMGFKFEYDDTFGQAKTITLQLEDIIEAAGEELSVVLPDASFDYDKFWKRFDGRMFRWTEEDESGDPSLRETIETVVSRDSIGFLSQKAGRLLGQSGQIYKEIYVKDSGKQKRNYYMQYVIQSKTVDDQKRRIAELEEALVQLQTIIAQKDARIEELEGNNP